MEILVIGNEQNLFECQVKWGNVHSYKMADSAQEIQRLSTPETVAFDFKADGHPVPGLFKAIFLSTVKNTLSDQLRRVDTGNVVFGFCGLPTFFNRPVIELVAGADEQQKLLSIAEQLSLKYCLVNDQVGLITPRIIGMIINEAYLSLEDSIATREDIDLAMKLGTNYPFGPFEWCKRIGVRNTFELLNAIFLATGDERYRPADLLKQEAFA